MTFDVESVTVQPDAGKCMSETTATRDALQQRMMELNQEQQGGFNLCGISTAGRTATRHRRLGQSRGVNTRTEKALEDNAKEPKTLRYAYARLQSGVRARA